MQKSLSQPASTARLPKPVRRALTELIAHLCLIVLGATFALPFAWMLSTSLKPDQQVFILPPQWIPQPFVWSNYPRAMTYIPYFHYFMNTFYIALFNVVATLISCTLVAYGFARINWPGRNLLFGVLLATLMIPYPVTLIPTFLVFRRLGWVGTPVTAVTRPPRSGPIRRYFMPDHSTGL